jgi:bifunctional UDP-N-acetylglucosamine pyrophosphorylase/glucosamine-1-phosphate N-acetyltransferase
MSTPSAIILAAGKGTRMNSDLPKVAHEVAGQAMVRWVVEACREAGCRKIVVVVGYAQDIVRKALSGLEVEFAEQTEQHGTGHAVRCAEAHFTQGAALTPGDAFVLAGDGPLIRGETLRTLLERHRSTKAAATLATSVIDNPAGYGRIVRDAAGRFVGIVEEKNASPAQKSIREVNPSYYCFDIPALFASLAKVKRNEASGEYYITDVPTLLMSEGRRVEVIEAVPPEDVLSINDQTQLAEVDRILRTRVSRATPGRPVSHLTGGRADHVL